MGKSRSAEILRHLGTGGFFLVTVHVSFPSTGLGKGEGFGS